MHDEFSVVGVAKDAPGALVVAVPEPSRAYALGLRKGDFIQRVNECNVANAKEFVEAASGSRSFQLLIMRSQQPKAIAINLDGP